MKVTVKRSNQRFLQMISDQMESDPTEALNYLLTELRRVNFSFNSITTLSIAKPLTESSTESLAQTDEACFGTGHLRQIVEKDLSEIDPTIQKLLAVGLDEF